MTPRGPIELHVAAGALLELGDDVTPEGGVSIEAVDSVVVEAGTWSGAWSASLDDPLPSLGGVGRGAAAGSVVSSDVPANHPACGDPARLAPLSLLSRDPNSVPGRRIAR